MSRSKVTFLVQGFVAVAAVLLLATSTSGVSARSWPALLGSPEVFPLDVSAAVERIWLDPTISRTVNGRSARVPFEVYVAFMATPEVTVAAARFRKLGNFEIQALDDDRYWVSDGDGACGLAQVLRREPRRLIMLSRGEHTGPFLGTISGSALTIVDLESREDAVNPRLTAYVYIDNRVAAALARVLISTFGFIADRKLGEGLRVTAEVAEWAVDPSGGFCDWLAQEPVPPASRDRIRAALRSCAAPDPD